MNPLRVAIIHYHLRGGGVTVICRNIQESFSHDEIKTAVCVGESPEQTAIRNVALVPGLSYNTSIRPSSTLCDDLKQAALKALGGAPDIWHFHNHSLGKNLAMPMLVEQLSSQGERLLLHIHDFAEDGRPANYSFLRDALKDKPEKRLYPQRENVHYAVLNSRDAGFLKNAGVSSARLHLLPNAVSWSAAPDREATAEIRLLLYPTRAIRRKNIGELLFWSCFAEKGDVFGTTLIPRNPKALPIYNSWVAFAEEQNLPVSFGMGEDADFMSLVGQASALITTSVAEGFGMAFLEPGLAGKPLFGRKLPEITDEFEKNGLNLSHLYSRLEIPYAWSGDALGRKIRDALSETMAAYGREMSEADYERAYSAVVQNDTVDFGRLDEELQQKAIRRIVADRSARQEVSPLSLEGGESLEKSVNNNRAAALRHYSTKEYGNKLKIIYKQLAAAGTNEEEPLNRKMLLDQFLDPQRFYLLRT